ncbi:unnamed protein product [Lasius platythorax]|uniref:Uncharacterized protein n=1 Tax=Lasius platythorax TaxID=488582 RepID=A0AAV2N122_9HYME
MSFESQYPSSHSEDPDVRWTLWFLKTKAEELFGIRDKGYIIRPNYLELGAETEVSLGQRNRTVTAQTLVLGQDKVPGDRQ